MKRILILTLLLCAAASAVRAQQVLRIHMPDDRVDQFQTAKIDSITTSREGGVLNLNIWLHSRRTVVYRADNVDSLTVIDLADESDLPYSASFATSLAGWTNYTTSGSGGWKTDYQTAYASGYNASSRTTVAGTYYLVSPAIKLPGKAVHLLYNYLLRYNRGDANQQLLIINAEDFSADNAAQGWTVLTQKHEESSNYTTFHDADVQVPSAFLGKTVRFAFRYNCGTTSSTWEVRSFSAQAGNAAEDPLAALGRKAYVPRRLEVPALKDASQLISHWTVEGGDSVMNYCLEFDPSAYHSRWVALRFDATTRQRNTSRSDEPFTDDPDLPAAYRIGSSTFGSGYDRGHICGSADRLYSDAANAQTFYMTNISPQLASFNQGYWITLENKVRNLGRDASFADTLYVVKGGTTASDLRLGTINRSGKRVAIPKYYFMALLRVKNGAYSAVGFLMEHKEYGYTNSDQAPASVLAGHAMSIDRLEEVTGLDFFHNLPDDTERTVEASYTPSLWGL
ncbi:MAG: DNA/RNA non-specific endonuclease [Alloprevotella sp.]|nr:DNA/RNA non-specific endonuclease [Alloprevotella sp.]